jgi:hypothetical protein
MADCTVLSPVIQCGQTIAGELTTDDCAGDGFYADLYRFAGANGQQVGIDMRSEELDSYLDLSRLGQPIFASDDDSGAGVDARIVTTLNSTGDWYISAANSVPFDTGPYTLSLQCDGALPSCTPSATALCLGTDARFKVEATFLTPGGQGGQAKVVKLTSETGYLWFFTDTNVEVVVKVLNACGFNQRYWVFTGGLTNVQVVLKVTDTQTGAVKTYTNPQNTKYVAIQDTSAFATCP